MGERRPGVAVVAWDAAGGSMTSSGKIGAWPTFSAARACIWPRTVWTISAGLIACVFHPIAVNSQWPRRALSISQGDWTTLVGSPVAATLLALAALAVVLPLLLRLRGRGQVLASLGGDED